MEKLKTFIKATIQPTLHPHWAGDLLLFIPRFVCGFFLTRNFGGDKFGMPWSADGVELGLFEVASWFPEDVAAFGVPFSWSPWLFAWLGAASEAIGGTFLILGLGTRFWGFMIACTMLTAIFFQKWGDFLEWGPWAILPALGFFWVALYSIVNGSGRFGIDFLVSTKFN